MTRGLHRKSGKGRADDFIHSNKSEPAAGGPTDEALRRANGDEKILIPGVITQSTVLVDHPELVAQRICSFAEVVGRERVIAGADCGFVSFAGSNEVHPSIIWAKFKSLVEGAGRATARLWT